MEIIVLLMLKLSIHDYASFARSMNNYADYAATITILWIKTK